MNIMRFFMYLFLLLIPIFPLTAQYVEVPREVKGLKAPVLSLNGTWKFDPHFRDAYKGASFSLKGMKDIRVPGEWVMQGFHVEAGRAAAYVRECSIPPSWKGKRVMLRCDAVFSRAEVWVNGRYAGSHLGGMTPFELDVTSLVRPGKENRIVLAVTAETIADTLVANGARVVYTDIDRAEAERSAFASSGSMVR
jgi:beta-galactosidase/beta-glucuronidase